MTKRANRIPAPERKAMQRVEKARAAYAKAEGRVGDLRLVLGRAEQKLARRAERLATAESTLGALVAPAAPPSAPTPERVAEELAAMAGSATENGATPAPRTRSRRKSATPDET